MRCLTKPLQAAQAVMRLAGTLLHSEESPSLPGERQLAAEIDISRSTLQHALQILKACDVIRSEQGRGNFALPESRWRPLPDPGSQILLICPRAFTLPGARFMFRMMLKGIRGAAAACACELRVLPYSAPDAGAVDAEAHADRSRGIILVDPRPGLVWKLLRSTESRLVLLEHDIRDLPVTSVFDGSFAGMYDATTALLQLGHRRIAFLDRPDWERANPVKVDGYRAALEAAGLGAEDEVTRLVRPERQSVFAVMDETCGCRQRPTAVVCHSDAVALDVMEWLRERGLAAGSDLSIVGSGDAAYRENVCRELSSIRVHFRTMGATAAFEAICGVRLIDAMRTVIVPNVLKIRDSVGPPGSALPGT